MKKIIPIILIMAIICSLLVSCDNHNESESMDLSVGQLGNVPDFFNGNILTKQLLMKAVTVSDGYLMANNAIEKYDKSGNLIWRKTYPFFSDVDSYYDIIIRPLADESFIFSYGAGAYQNQDGSWTITDNVLAKCDRNGNLIWQHTFEKFADTIVQRIYQVDSGNIITVGYSGEYVDLPWGEQEDIYLSLFSQDGELIKTVRYGGSDFDQLQDAEYISGIGLVALFMSQSKDGTFSASPNGYGVDIIALIDDELNIKWHKELGTLLSPDSLLATSEFIYLLDLQNNYYKLDYDGNILLNEPIADKSVSMQFVGESSRGQIMQADNKVIFYNDLEVNQAIDFDAGSVSKLIETKDGFVIISTNTTGQLPTPLYISSLWYSYEIVHSGYDHNGKLLWRVSHDITPKEWYDYDPVNSDFD